MKQKKIIIIGVAVILLIAVMVGIVLLVRGRKETVETMSPTESNLNLPDILEEDFKYDISTPDPITGEVNFAISSKGKDYDVYYAIVEITEGENIDNINDVEESAYCLYESNFKIDRNSVILFKYKKDGRFSNKPYKVVINNLSYVIDENVTNEELKNAQINKNEQKQYKYPYYIKVNYGANVVTIYQKDDKGEYTVPVKAMVCSCGTATPTSGVYKTSNKYVWRALIDGVHGQYATRIVKNILFHSVPYTAQKKDKLEYWEYDKLGTKASAGCVRLTVSDAKWIYDNCSSGTMVEFYSSSDPGPLGKPSAQKISGNIEYRNWDPTDPDSRNPWRGGNGITTVPTTQNKPTTPTIPIEPTKPVQQPIPGNNVTGNTTKPINNTTGNTTKPVNNTTGNATKPVNNITGNTTKPINNTMGNTTKPVNNTTGNTTKPVNNTTGNTTKPVNNTTGSTNK